MEALGEGEEQKGLWEEAKAKFQWLCPSKIRDSKGRKPEDPLYDKRTLQIPPDLLCTMSASQKQYWTTKCQYMDTILFFKVVGFFFVLLHLVSLKCRDILHVKCIDIFKSLRENSMSFTRLMQKWGIKSLIGK